VKIAVFDVPGDGELAVIGRAAVKVG